VSLGLSEPEETGTTFRDNARIKATAAAERSVAAGVRDDSARSRCARRRARRISARWAGPDKDFGARCK